jgi:hypothetical protein
VISVELARALRDTGVRWEPEPGDKFVIPDRQMDDEVFVVSTMVIDVHEASAGRIIRFNGTVEWALDSVQQADALWLPSESQLRTLLRGTFRSLRRANGGYRVELEVAGRPLEVSGDDPEEAYARAILHLLAP